MQLWQSTMQNNLASLGMSVCKEEGKEIWTEETIISAFFTHVTNMPTSSIAALRNKNRTPSSPSQSEIMIELWLNYNKDSNSRIGGKENVDISKQKLKSRFEKKGGGCW